MPVQSVFCIEIVDDPVVFLERVPVLMPNSMCVLRTVLFIFIMIEIPSWESYKFGVFDHK